MLIIGRKKGTVGLSAVKAGKAFKLDFKLADLTYFQLRGGHVKTGRRPAIMTTCQAHPWLMKGDSSAYEVMENERAPCTPDTSPVSIARTQTGQSQESVFEQFEAGLYSHKTFSIAKDASAQHSPRAARQTKNSSEREKPDRLKTAENRHRRLKLATMAYAAVLKRAIVIRAR